MTPQAIRDGFSRCAAVPRCSASRNAAVCRSESDWLVGINGTRAMTAFNSKTGGFHLTTVGRVQTPTLALIVDREDRIRKFKPRAYWESRAASPVLPANTGANGSTRSSRARMTTNMRAPTASGTKPERHHAAAEMRGKDGEVSEESKASTQLSPLLYDLTSLQREANGRFGFSAKATLGLAQALYEKHKVLTYPRTDSRALARRLPPDGQQHARDAHRRGYRQGPR
jgi:DNA topoisomerase-3